MALIGAIYSASVVIVVQLSIKTLGWFLADTKKHEEKKTEWRRWMRFKDRFC